MEYACKICSARYLQDLQISDEQRLSNVRLLYFFDDKATLRLGDAVRRVRPRQVYLLPSSMPVEVCGEKSRCYEAVVRMGEEKPAANVVPLDEEQRRAVRLIDSKMKPWLAIADSEHLYLVLVNLLYELCTQSAYRAENIRNLVGLALAQIAEKDVYQRQMVDGAPTFTVGVPFIQDELVLGAVLIQTKAQTIEGGTGDFLQTIVLVGSGAALLAALLVFFYTRRLIRPLSVMADAAGRMAQGQFDTLSLIHI